MPTGAIVALYSGMRGDTTVRCSRGHLFTTRWVVGSSVKAAGRRKLARTDRTLHDVFGITRANNTLHLR
ncbi:MAG TPA: hypothetical protein VGF51_16565 [Acidimicrobiales bacterium]|jgi:hypothetical protein